MRQQLLVQSLTPAGYCRFRFLSVKSCLSYDSILWSMDTEVHWCVMVYPSSSNWHWLSDLSYLQSPKSIRDNREPVVGMRVVTHKKTKKKTKSITHLPAKHATTIVSLSFISSACSWQHHTRGKKARDWDKASHFWLAGWIFNPAVWGSGRGWHGRTIALRRFTFLSNR